MIPLINREKSWLLFNERVLQEAEDQSVPLISRIRFLGIFSNNLDEFFRVRYAYVRRASVSTKDRLGKGGQKSATKLLNEITEIVKKQQKKAQDLLEGLEEDLRKKNVYIVYDESVDIFHFDYIKNLFVQVINPTLMVIMLDQIEQFPNLKDSAIYLAVEMKSKTTEKVKTKYAIIEIPTHLHGRFIILPSKGKNKYIMLLDDLIRFNLDYVFRFFDYEDFRASTIKITRDAELDIDNDISRSFIDKISRSLKKRASSRAVRLVYQNTISDDFIHLLKKLMKIDEYDSISPGGKYHNKKDYIKFPNILYPTAEYKNIKPLQIKDFSLSNNLFDQIKEKDRLLYTPYQDFYYIISLLKEASINPNVDTIKITLYRLADDSKIVGALINAARNGKKVIVQIELRARFDEAANIFWAEKMKVEGITLIFGIKGLKVHSKICIVINKSDKKFRLHGFISTGNFNETTAKIYTDYTLFTANQSLLNDVEKVFGFFEASYKVPKYKHLVVSPHYTRKTLISLIHREIENVKAGKKAVIKMRMNSLTDEKLILALYEASQNGVKIKLVVRGICSLVPGVVDISENIEAISVVDKYLEHSRVYVFENSGDEDVFISSSDLMGRNLDHRVEVTCPIYDKEIKQEILDTLDIIWSDNLKARIFNENQNNQYRKKSVKKIRTHTETFKYYENKVKENIKNES